MLKVPLVSDDLFQILSPSNFRSKVCARTQCCMTLTGKYARARMGRREIYVAIWSTEGLAGQLSLHTTTTNYFEKEIQMTGRELLLEG